MNIQELIKLGNDRAPQAPKHNNTYYNTVSGDIDLTDNEFKAAVALLKSCLWNMGGERPAALLVDEFTWVQASDLVDAGWSKQEAAGTYGALAEKVIVCLDEDGDTLSWGFWLWCDTIWQEINENE